MKIVDCKELALKKVSFLGDVVGKFGTFEIEQVFVNETNDVLEVNYTFPIVETATVTGFEVCVGDNVIKGVCKEKNEAVAEYYENIVKGNSAYMLNQDADNIFNVSVGKVDKNEEVKIKITYIDIFQIVDNEIKIIIPTLVYPRYKSEITDGLTYGKVEYTADFNINLNKVSNVASITSQTHDISIEEGEDTFKINSKNYDMSSDFMLNIKLKEEANSNAVFSKIETGEDVVCLSFMPEIENVYEDSEKEYIFVVDVSGSMAGKKLEETKRAVKECLKQLDVGDKFNIIPFESSYTAFEIDSVEYTEENLKKAEKYIDSLVARGGTEILLPIKFALYEPSDDKVILLFTDGQVGNENQIFNFVAEAIGNSKLFAFGIDFSINTSFVRNLAMCGNGKAEFIRPDEKIDDKIIRTFARIQTPLVEELTIDYGKNKILDEIKEDNKLFNYEFYNVIAKLEKLEDDIVLKGKIAGKLYEWKVKKEDIKQSDVNLESVYAKLQINRLEEYIRIMPHNKKEIYVKMIVDISTKCGIATKYTTFISVYERKNKIIEIPKIQNVILSDTSLEKCNSAVLANSIDIPTFLRKTKRTYSSTIDAVHESESLYCVGDDYEIKIHEKLEKYFDEKEIEDITIFILFAIYFYKNNSYMLSEEEIIEMLNKNIETIKNDDKLMKLVFVLYLNSASGVKEYIYENILSSKFKKIVDTKMNYTVKFECEKIAEKDILDWIEKDVEKALWCLNDI